MNEIASIYLDIYEVKMLQIKGKKKNKAEFYNKANINALTSIEK